LVRLTLPVPNERTKMGKVKRKEENGVPEPPPKGGGGVGGTGARNKTGHLTDKVKMKKKN